MPFLSLILLVVVVAALVDIIVRDDSQVRHLPKLVWILLVVFLPLIGSAVWFIAGHDWTAARPAIPLGDPRRQEEATARLASDADTQAQLAALEAEIERSEREERIRRLEAELQAKRRGESADA